MKINLFTPIVYPKEKKTSAQRWLERCDGYLDLFNRGGTRVCVMPPDAINPTPWSLEIPDRDRSWIHVALKVISYCTIVLPLIALVAKVGLRWANDIKAVDQTGRMDPLVFKGELVKLLQNYNTFENKEDWTLQMNALFAKCYFSNVADEFIATHANIYKLIKDDWTEDLALRLCKYLGKNQLVDDCSWIYYRVFEQYLDFSTERIVSTARKIIFHPQCIPLTNRKMITQNGTHFFNVRIATIDPTDWFGDDLSEYAFHRKEKFIPPFILEGLKEAIYQIIQKAKKDNTALIIEMKGNDDTTLPKDFTLELARCITWQMVLLDAGDTLKTSLEVYQNYLIVNGQLSSEQLSELSSSTRIYPIAAGENS